MRERYRGRSSVNSHGTELTSNSTLLDEVSSTSIYKVPRTTASPWHVTNV